MSDRTLPQPDRRTVLKLAVAAAASRPRHLIAANTLPPAVEPKLAPEGDPMPAGGKRLASVDPALNTAVVIDGTAVWAYRYRAGSD